MRVDLFSHDMEGQGVPLFRAEELHDQQFMSEPVKGESEGSAQLPGKHDRHHQQGAGGSCPDYQALQAALQGIQYRSLSSCPFVCRKIPCW